MTENKQEEKKQLATQPKQAKQCILFPWLIGLICILAFASLILSIQAFRQNNSSTDRNQQLLGQIEQFKQAQSSAQKQVQLKADQIIDLQAELQSQIDVLKTQGDKDSDPASQEQHWLLLKARYLLELAQINAHWSTDYSSSIALLEQADALLRSLNLSKILEIRQAIAKEITELKANPAIDVAGLLSQLDAAQVTVANLNTQYSMEKQEAKAQSTAAKQANDWHAYLKNNLKALERLVVIRRDDEEVTHLMSPLYKSIIKETILLNLQEAQWAVINHQVDVYQLVLKQAIQHIQKTADEKEPQTLALIKQLTELQQAQLASNKPKIGLAIPLVNQLIESKQSRINPINKSGAKQP